MLGAISYVAAFFMQGSRMMQRPPQTSKVENLAMVKADDFFDSATSG